MARKPVCCEFCGQPLKTPSGHVNARLISMRWRAQYFREGRWDNFDFKPASIYRQLRRLGDTASRKRVEEIIGNDTWTKRAS